MPELDFNSEGITPWSQRDAVPPGRYIAAIDSSDKRRNKNDTGDLLILTWEILEGECKGSQIPEFLNVTHESEQAERIAESKLASICLATGKHKVKRSEELHGIPVEIIVGARKDGEGTEVKSHHALNKTPASPVVETKVRASGEAGKPPWAR